MFTQEISWNAPCVKHKSLKRLDALRIFVLLSRTLEALCVSWRRTPHTSETGTLRAYRTTRALVTVCIATLDIMAMRSWWGGLTRKIFSGFEALNCLDLRYAPRMCGRSPLSRLGLIASPAVANDEADEYWESEDDDTTSAAPEGNSGRATASTVGPRLLLYYSSFL